MLPAKEASFFVVLFGISFYLHYLCTINVVKQLNNTIVSMKYIGFALLGFVVLVLVVALMVFFNYTTLVWGVGCFGAYVVSLSIAVSMTDSKGLEALIQLVCMVVICGALYFCGSYVNSNTTRVIVVGGKNGYQEKNIWQGGQYEYTSSTGDAQTIQLEGGKVYVDNQTTRPLYFIRYSYGAAKYASFGSGPRVQEVCEEHEVANIENFPDYVLKKAPEKISIHFWESSTRYSLEFEEP